MITRVQLGHLLELEPSATVRTFGRPRRRKASVAHGPNSLLSLPGSNHEVEATGTTPSAMQSSCSFTDGHQPAAAAPMVVCRTCGAMVTG